MPSPSLLLRALPLLAVALLLLAPVSGAHIGGAPGSGEPWEPAPPSEDIRMPRGERPCPNAHPGWRKAQTVLNVSMQASPVCQPDNPELVAAFVEGTNNVPKGLLDRNALHEDAVVKGRDLDGDGDPDEINITLEVIELNGWHLSEDDLAETFDIAPGISPGFWVFAPKGTIDHTGEQFFDLARVPSAPIRAEVNDTIRITLENTHYFPHTIHLHGVDHPFQDADGEGNDGVPHISEEPVLPGEERTYEFKARQPGTMFYHCHVQPAVHVMMGLGTTIVVEEDRENNTLQTINPGGGQVRVPSKGVLEDHDREYDLIFQDVDKELNNLIKTSNDPRVLAKKMNREYDPTDRDADYFLLNGRSFPYTLRESLVVVGPDERVKMRVINAGEETLSLHTHGHKGIITATDGRTVPEGQRTQRDVYTLTGAQRLDITLNTTDDGLNSYGPGAWFMHDHRERAVTTDGIGPGGDISLIVYESYMNETRAMPETAAPLDLFFTPDYYQGKVPVWTGLDQPGIFGEIAANATSADDAGEDRTTVPAAGAAAIGVLILSAVAVARWRREGAP